MEKLTHLYRLRVLFDETGALTLVETVEKSVIVDGAERHTAGETVRTFDVDKVDRGMIRAVIAHLGEVGEAMRREVEAKKAEAARRDQEARAQAEREAEGKKKVRAEREQAAESKRKTRTKKAKA